MFRIPSVAEEDEAAIETAAAHAASRPRLSDAALQHDNEFVQELTPREAATTAVVKRDRLGRDFESVYGEDDIPQARIAPVGYATRRDRGVDAASGFRSRREGEHAKDYSAAVDAYLKQGSVMRTRPYVPYDAAAQQRTASMRDLRDSTLGTLGSAALEVGRAAAPHALVPALASMYDPAYGPLAYNFMGGDIGTAAAVARGVKRGPLGGLLPVSESDIDKADAAGRTLGSLWSGSQMLGNTLTEVGRAVNPFAGAAPANSTISSRIMNVSTLPESVRPALSAASAAAAEAWRNRDFTVPAAVAAPAVAKAGYVAAPLASYAVGKVLSTARKAPKKMAAMKRKYEQINARRKATRDALKAALRSVEEEDDEEDDEY